MDDDEYIVDLGSDEDYIYVDHSNDEIRDDDSYDYPEHEDFHDEVSGDDSIQEDNDPPVVEVNPLKNILFRNSKPKNPNGINNSGLTEVIRGSSKINLSKEEIKYVKGEIIDEGEDYINVPSEDDVVEAKIISNNSSKNDGLNSEDFNSDVGINDNMNITFDHHLKNKPSENDFVNIIDETFDNNPDGNLSDEDISVIASALVNKAFDKVISDKFNENNDKQNTRFKDNDVDSSIEISDNTDVSHDVGEVSAMPDGITYYEGVKDIKNPLKRNNLYYDDNANENKSVKNSIKNSIRDIRYIHKSLNEIENPTPVGYVSVVDRTKEYDDSTPDEGDKKFVSHNDEFVSVRTNKIDYKKEVKSDNFKDEFINNSVAEDFNKENFEDDFDDLENIVRIVDKDYKEIEKKRFEKNNKLKSFDDNKLPKKGNVDDEIIDYEFAHDFGLDSQDDLFKKPIDDVSNSINEIIKIEGPIHIDEVIKRVKDACHIKRAGANMKKQVNRAVKNSEDGGNIIKIDNFLYDSSVNDVVIRRRKKPKIDLISDEEIAKNIKTTLQHRKVLSTNLLIREVSRNFGFKSTSRKTSAKINSVLDSLIADSTVKLNEDTVELK